MKGVVRRRLDDGITSGNRVPYHRDGRQHGAVAGNDMQGTRAESAYVPLCAARGRPRVNPAVEKLTTDLRNHVLELGADKQARKARKTIA